MKHASYCEDCDIEFRVMHEDDNDTFLVMFCPFCGGELKGEQFAEYGEEDGDAPEE